MSETIKISKANGVWSVRAGGAVLGESKNALELNEGEFPSVIYFPRSDLAMAFLEKTDKSSFCPQKGDASYYSIVTKSTTLENSCWSYEHPNETVIGLKDHIAFFKTETVAVEQI